MSGPELSSDAARPARARVGQLSRRWALLGATAVLAAAAAAVRFRAAAPGPDEVDAAEATRRGIALAALGPLPLAQVALNNVATAFGGSGLSSGESNTLAADAKAGRVRVVLLSVYDSDVEDGDVVEIRGSGFSQIVRLTKAPVAVAVPVGPDNTISLAGLVDGGGGGVTVGLILPSGPFPLPPLSVGQVLRLPVGPAR